MTGKELGDKKGRPRRYDFVGAEGYSDAFAAYAVPVLDELLQRVVDQVDDLPSQAFAFTSAGSWFCLGWLPLHLAVSEYRQMQRLAAALGLPVPELDRAVLSRIEYGGLETSGAVPAEILQAPLLIDAMRRVRNHVTVPLARAISDSSRPIENAEKLSTPQNVLMHLIWHWTYHSGHIGLMRLEWGSDYEWVMAPAPMS